MHYRLDAFGRVRYQLVQPGPVVGLRARGVPIALASLCFAALAGVAQAAESAAPLQVLDPVIVTSIRTETSVLDTPASVNVVDGSQMRDGRMQVNLSESLGAVPGLQIQNRQNYAQDLQISMRGFGARSTFGVRGLRLYVDGIPATMPDGQGQTSNIDIATIDRVEILRGPFSALYGNSSGGVLQVFTHEGQAPPSLGASFAAGSDASYRYGIRAQGARGTGPGAMDYTLGISRFTTDGYRDHSEASKNLGNARLGVQLDDDSRLTLLLNHVDLRAQDPLGLTREQYETDPRSAALAEQYNTRKTVKQSQGGLRYERRIDADNELSLMVYYGQRDTGQYQSIPPFVQERPLHAGGVIDLSRDYAGTDLRWTSRLSLAGRALTVIGGLAYDQMTEERLGYRNFIDTSNGPELGVRGELRRDETNRVRNTDPYVQASWDFAQRWTLDAGLRYSTVKFRSRDHFIDGANGDDSGDASYREALPVAALRYAATPGLNLYASFGRGFETPTFNEVSYRPDGLAGLNFDLKPAINTSVEVGAKARAAGGLVTAAIFQTNTEDEIVTAVSSGGRSTYQNAGRTRRNGLELSWDAEYANHWRTQFSYTFLDAKYRDDVCSPAACGMNPIRSGNRIPGIARQAAYASVSWAPPQGWRAGVDARYLSDIYVNDDNSEAAPGYTVVGVGAGYLWQAGHWEWNAFARLDNLFDRKYVGSVIVNEGNGRYFEPAAGRNWVAGLAASYTF